MQSYNIVLAGRFRILKGVVQFTPMFRVVYFTGGGKSLTVKIFASYDPPSTFTLSPPSYRAASPLSLTCEVEGLDDYTGVLYEWSSTCTGNCFSREGTTRTVSTEYLYSYDTGNHTCTVYDTLGCTWNASFFVEVVGKVRIIPRWKSVFGYYFCLVYERTKKL